MYSIKGAGVSAVPATGGASVPVTAGSGDFTIQRAGRAAIARSVTDGTLTAWSKASGARVIPNLPLDPSTPLGVYDTPSGDFALLLPTTGGAYVLDAAALTLTAIPTLTGAGADCHTSGDTLACTQPDAAGTTAKVFTVDKTGEHDRAVVASGMYGFVPYLVNDDLIYSDGSSTYRLAASATTPEVLFQGGTAVAALQDNWLAITAADGVHVMKADGSQSKLVASGGHLSSYSTNLTDGHDWARVRWAAICDGTANMVDGESNLRVYDPGSDRTVSLSKTGCDLRAITYSDNFAFFVDGAHYVNEPVVQEAGTCTVVDLRDGSSRGNPTGMDMFFDHRAFPIGKSRLLFSWLAYSSLVYGAYYDGHSPAGDGVAQYTSPSGFEGYRLLAGDKGVILPSGIADNTPYTLYYAALP